MMMPPEVVLRPAPSPLAEMYKTDDFRKEWSSSILRMNVDHELRSVLNNIPDSLLRTRASTQLRYLGIHSIPQLMSRIETLDRIKGFGPKTYNALREAAYDYLVAGNSTDQFAASLCIASLLG